MLVSRAQLGAAIAEARSKAGLTQVELAQRAGLEEIRRQRPGTGTI